MTKCRCSYCASRTERRNFRQDHGGGPEIPPHRKKRNKVDRAHCDHQWSQWYDKSSRYGGHDKHKDTWRWTIWNYKHRVCRNCGKRDHQSEWTTEYYKMGPDEHPIRITYEEYLRR